MTRILWASGFVVFWSSGFVGAELASASDPTAVLAWRYLATAVVLLLITLPRRPRIPAPVIGRQMAIGLLAHVVFLGGVFGASAVGVAPGTVALVCATQPMLVTLIGWVCWRERPGGGVLLGLLLGLVAVAVTVGLGTTAGPGVLLPVLSLLALSAAAVAERRWPVGTDVLTALTIQVVVAAAVFTGYAAVNGRLLVPVTADLLAAIGWLVLLSGIGGYATFLVCLRRLGAARTSSLLYLTPPVTTLWAWALFGRPPGGNELVGLLLGTAAVTLVLLGRRRQPDPAGVGH
ncbi:DMT family transporter [Enemella evansiae]|uniref:DMT family transporter n=1 Tax=Enemella evansiae TaxID=2016499 RepID=UPI000B96610D|nr:DMT family transporter [Enemella evansiae]OYO05834.1 hypothetical protein CGZ97_03845 [Enemella evansiae]